MADNIIIKLTEEDIPSVKVTPYSIGTITGGKVNDVLVDGVSVVTDEVANIDLSSRAMIDLSNVAEGDFFDKSVESGVLKIVEITDSNNRYWGRYIYDALGINPTEEVTTQIGSEVYLKVTSNYGTAFISAKFLGVANERAMFIMKGSFFFSEDEFGNAILWPSIEDGFYNEYKVILNDDSTYNSELSELMLETEQGATAYKLMVNLQTKVDKITGKGLSSNDYTTLEKNKLAGLSNYDDTSLKNLINEVELRDNKVYNTSYSAGIYTISETIDLTKNNKITVFFSSLNVVANPKLRINGIDHPMKTNGKLLDFGQIQAQEISDVWITGGEARLYGDDVDRASDAETLALISDTAYMSPKRVGMALDMHNQNASAHDLLYQKSKAYTDASVKDTEPIPIYILPTSLSFTRPTGAGTEITISATTTEQVFFDRSLAIGRNGQVSPNNLYWLKLYFRSVSSSRITYMRVQYFVKDIELINEVNVLNNAQSDFEFGDFLPMNKINQALDYTATDQLRIVLSFWVSTGTDTLYLLAGDTTNTSSLVRLEPISTGVTKGYVDDAIKAITASGVKYGAGTQYDFNEQVKIDIAILYDFASPYFSFDIDTTVGGTLPTDNTFILPFDTSSVTRNYEMKVDWGDGTVENIGTAFSFATPKTHTYTNAGKYRIRIISKEKMPRFSPYLYHRAINSNILKVTSYNTPLLRMNNNGLVDVLDVTFMNYGCTKLKTIADELFRNNPELTQMGGCFKSCSNLQTIPPNIFRYNVNVTNFLYVFSDCIEITSIPVDLFKFNTKVTTFKAAFITCSKLSTVPADLFRYNTEVRDFSYLFESNTAITSIPNDFFRYNTKVTTFEHVMNLCLSATIPNSLFRYNLLATNFNFALNNCRAAKITADIFCDETTEMATRFAGQTVDFTNFIYRTTPNTSANGGTAPQLWNYTMAGSTKTSCFGGTGNNGTTITNYANIPTEWK